MRRLSGLVGAAMLVGATAMAFAAVVAVAAAPARPTCKGRPMVIVRRGPVIARIYSAPHGRAELCAAGYGTSVAASDGNESHARVPARAIQVFWAGVGAPRGGFVVLYGRVGRSVTAVTIKRSNHFAPVRARVAHGWYVALWLGTHATHGTKVLITADSITRTYPLPVADRQGVPDCGGPGSACGGIGPGQTVGR